MSKSALDLSKFRKIKSDGNTSTFRHHQGHEITIAHNKLSSKMKEQLNKIPTVKSKEKPIMMAEAGTVPNPEPNEDTDDSQPNVSASDEQAANTQDQGPGPANMPSPEQPPQAGMVGALESQVGHIQQQSAGQQAEAQAVGAQGTANIEAEKQNQNNQNNTFDQYHMQWQNLADQRQDLMKDIAAGHIKPTDYIDKMDTGTKIRTGIGLILGGMGAGLTHGPNLAFQYLQNQIDRDIEGQKVDLGNKNSLLAHNLQASGDLNQAMGVTRMQNNDLLASHLRMEADKQADPIARARTMQIAGMLGQQADQIQGQVARMKVMQSAFGGQGGGLAMETLPPEMRERAVQMPDGSLKLAISKDGAKSVREQMQTMQPIMDSLDQLKSLGPSALVPGSPAYQQAKSIQAQLIPLVNENAGLKRLSGEDIGNIKHMFSDPTTFSGLLTGARTDSFKSFLQNKMMNTMSNQLEGGAKMGHRPSAGNFGFKPRS